MVCPAMAASNTEFGLLTMACVMPTICAGGDRKAVGLVRICSGK